LSQLDTFCRLMDQDTCATVLCGQLYQAIDDLSC
jgi:hypothetical protein